MAPQQVPVKETGACRTCGKTKPLSGFHCNGKGRYDTNCKLCTAERGKQFYWEVQRWRLMERRAAALRRVSPPKARDADSVYRAWNRKARKRKPVLLDRHPDCRRFLELLHISRDLGGPGDIGSNLPLVELYMGRPPRSGRSVLMEAAI